MIRLTAKDIATRLAARTEAVCRFLLPNGKMDSGNWCVGGVGGQEGKSLKIQVTGSKSGIWSDFASTSDSGDLLDLWSAVTGKTLPESIGEAKKWLGVAEPESVIPMKRWTPPPEKPRGVSTTKRQKAFSYLGNDRKIPEQVLMAYRISQRDETDMVFPSFSPEGELVNIKYIGFVRDEKGKKAISQEKGCAPALFGWQSLNRKPPPREIVITEGQIDAMTWSAWGFPALSMPNGVGDLSGWIDYEWDNLAQFDVIYLSFDEDPPGQRAIADVARRLGIHRCMIVRLPEPHKDANDCLMAGIKSDEAGRMIANARPISPTEIKTPMDFLDEIVELFNPTEPSGLWVPMFGENLRFRPGETTIWTGTSSHGKSTFLSQLMLHAAKAGQRAAIGSFEMRGAQTLKKMLKCLVLLDNPNVSEIERSLTWLGGKLWLYDIVGQVSKEKLVELMTYSCFRHSVQHFVIDSLMKCQVSGDDYEGQRNFLNWICTFASENKVHVHIVAHPRKGANDETAPGMVDIKGGSDLFNQPDNVVVVCRNKKKPIKSEFGIGEPDCTVSIKKQRETGMEFSVPLWFMTNLNRFCHKNPAGKIVIEDFEVLPKPELNL